MKQETLSLIQTEGFPQVNPFTRTGHQSLKMWHLKQLWCNTAGVWPKHPTPQQLLLTKNHLFWLSEIFFEHYYYKFIYSMWLSCKEL